MKEKYQNVKILLSAPNYDQFSWEIIGDFKMVAFLMGLWGGFRRGSLAIYSFGIGEIQPFTMRRGTVPSVLAMRL